MTAEFERLYRANVDAVTAYFARRSADPQAPARPSFSIGIVQSVERG